jgi:uncharacterized protein (TIGR03382 family)
MRNLVAGLVALVTLLAAKSAWAAFHIMQITEVFPGTNAQPNAQYIELQMYADGQNLVNGHTVTVFNAAGTQIMTYTFAANVASGTNQSTILIATTQAAALFAVTPDLTMTATIPLAGGKVCFETIDCVAWGNYTGGATPSPVGQPAYQARGLVLGRSLTRKLGANNMLDGGDDTAVSSADFARAVPSPRNNAGVTGTNPLSTCGNNAIEGLESCDDNNTTANDGCSAMCVTENCGDGVVQAPETCDDTNTNDTDACSNLCGVQTPAVDGPPDAGVNPMPDGGNNNNGDDGGGCCQTGGAGATPLLALLVLGLLARRRSAR